VGRAGKMPESRKNPKPEKCPKMRQNPHRPLHALLGGFVQYDVFEPAGFHYSFSLAVILACGRKRVMAVMKHRIFDVALKAKGIGEEGYEKPNKAQIENTKNIAARANKVYFDILVNGDKVSSEKLEISTRNKGRKKSKVSCADIGGYSLHITIRSYGSSNIIGADIVPTMALPSAIFSP
jgi:hypothetical protein